MLKQPPGMVHNQVNQKDSTYELVIRSPTVEATVTSAYHFENELDKAKYEETRHG
jgi:hypothetical protein